MRKFLLIMLCLLLLSPLCLVGCKEPGYNGTIIIPNEPSIDDNQENTNATDNDKDKPQDNDSNDNDTSTSDNPSDNKPNNDEEITDPSDKDDKVESKDLFSKDEKDRIINLVMQVCNELNCLQGVEPAVALTNENLRIVFCDDNFQTEQKAALDVYLAAAFEKENLDVKTNLFDGILTIYIKKIA